MEIHGIRRTLTALGLSAGVALVGTGCAVENQNTFQPETTPDPNEPDVQVLFDPTTIPHCLDGFPFGQGASAYILVQTEEEETSITEGVDFTILNGDNLLPAVPGEGDVLLEQGIKGLVTVDYLLGPGDPGFDPRNDGGGINGTHFVLGELELAEPQRLSVNAHYFPDGDFGWPDNVDEIEFLPSSADSRAIQNRTNSLLTAARAFQGWNPPESMPPGLEPIRNELEACRYQSAAILKRDSLKFIQSNPHVAELMANIGLRQLDRVVDIRFSTAVTPLPEGNF